MCSRTDSAPDKHMSCYEIKSCESHAADTETFSESPAQTQDLSEINFQDALALLALIRIIFVSTLLKHNASVAVVSVISFTSNIGT